MHAKKTGTNVQLIVDDVGEAKWVLTFDRNVCNEFHADLEVAAINKALHSHRRKLAREVLEGLLRRKLPGAVRGRLRSAVDAVISNYSL